MVEFHAVQVDPVAAERMEIAVAEPVPVDKLDAELEAAPGRGDEIGFLDAQHAIEIDEARYGRFADPHSADRFGFDQFDIHASGQDEARQGCRGHPARRAAPGNDDFGDGAVHDPASAPFGALAFVA